MKRFLLIALAVLFFFISFAAAEMPCEVLSPIKLSVASAPAGRMIRVISSINNCTSEEKTYALLGTEVAECGMSLVFIDTVGKMHPGEKVPFDVEARSAPIECPGPVTVTLRVYEGAQEVGKKVIILKAGLEAE